MSARNLGRPKLRRDEREDGLVTLPDSLALQEGWAGP